MNIRILLAILALVNANLLQAQFYTVEKLGSASVENTPTEYQGDSLFTQDRDGLPPVPSGLLLPDTLGALLFSPPLESGIIAVTSPYGYRDDPFTGKRRFHSGTDLRTKGEKVLSMMPGRVKDIGYSKSLGNYVVLEHGDFTVTYAHLHYAQGHKGDYIPGGQVCGFSGSTGRSTGTHLHVSIKYRGKRTDPYPIISYITEYVKGLSRQADATRSGHEAVPGDSPTQPSGAAL